MTTYVFTPPVTTRRTPEWQTHNRLFSLIQLKHGTSVLKIGTSYIPVENPTAEQVSSASVAYIGGRSYTVTAGEASSLTSAGYGAYITTV